MSFFFFFRFLGFFFFSILSLGQFPLISLVFHFFLHNPFEGKFNASLLFLNFELSCELFRAVRFFFFLGRHFGFVCFLIRLVFLSFFIVLNGGMGSKNINFFLKNPVFNF